VLFEIAKRAAQSEPPPRTRPKPRRRRNLPRWARNLLVAAAALVAALLLAFWLSKMWTDALWFEELGHANIFWTRIWAPLLFAVAGLLVFTAIFLGNLLLARLLSPRTALQQAGGDAADAEILELMPTSDRRVTRIIVVISVVIGLFFAVSAGGAWEEFLRCINQAPFSYTDPLFNHDASFFVYTLPVLRRVLGFLTGALIWSLLGVIGVYLFDRAISFPSARRLSLAPHVKAHISVLAALLLVGQAADFLLQSWELLYSTRGVVFGASYTDAVAQLPVLRILAVVSLVSAAIFLGNIHYRGWRLPLTAIGLLVVMWIGAGQIYPAIVHQYRVSPNEIKVESAYIAHNIKTTRWAFGLEGVATRSFPANENLTLANIENNEATVQNIRLWDTRSLLETYTQLQEIRLYYRFRDVDVDRYSIDGNYRQVMLSTRELDQEQLQDQAKTWVNEHLSYTHGYGVVVSAVNEVTTDGLPTFFVENIPPQTTTNLEISRPEIYYGEMGNEFVVVRTNAKEFDYPKGDENVLTTYEGGGGVPLTSVFRRLAFAMRFGDMNFLLSEYLTPESRVMFRRTIQERVRAIAPFLQYDQDPYLVIREDGSLAWVWDAYTVSNRFPYSEPRPNGINYIRNSVKVVIDAYDGNVTFYQMDPDDALATTYARMYPGLMTPADQLPADLRQHLRYPEDLFSIQAQVLSVYHMQDPQVFYNKEDVWQIPNEIYQAEQVPVDPYYVIMGLPGENEEEFLLMQPFSPLDKSNMIAWMAVRMDGEDYGQIQVYGFPKDKLVFGPSQIEATISSDPVISAQLSLWNQSGSRVIRGNFLVVPLEDSLIYVEPLFLQAEQSAIPALKRVIVSYADRVVMEPTLADALARLFGEATPGTTEPQGETTTTTVPAPSTTTSTTPVTTTGTLAPGETTTTGIQLPTDRESLILLADQLYQAALEAQRAGNWTEYGRLVQELGRVLETLRAQTGR